jgi:hypothetical protein
VVLASETSLTEELSTFSTLVQCVAGARIRRARRRTAEAARGLSGSGIVGRQAPLPEEPKADLSEDDDTKRFAGRLYGAVPTTCITDVLSHVACWTGFIEQFDHVSHRGEIHTVPANIFFP